MQLRRVAAGFLERGTFAWAESRVLRGLTSRAINRPLRRPPGIAVVTVGGSTLGGSGKTRVAIAAARVLADAGARVTLVGHGYRTRGPARVVNVDDALALVGDEALVAARALAGRATVVSGPIRQAAVDLAARGRPDVLVLDGPLQLSPERASLSLLAVDADRPWGAGADLRAPRDALLAHADHVVPVPALPRGAWLDAELVPLSSLPGRLGLFTAIARPDRLAVSLRQTGITLHAVVHAPDHGPVKERLAAHPVDLWLATAKCALHVQGAKVAILDGEFELPDVVRLALLSAHGGHP